MLLNYIVRDPISYRLSDVCRLFPITKYVIKHSNWQFYYLVVLLFKSNLIFTHFAFQWIQITEWWIVFFSQKCWITFKNSNKTNSIYVFGYPLRLYKRSNESRIKYYITSSTITSYEAPIIDVATAFQSSNPQFWGITIAILHN
jgi:hypothetical protein